MNYLILLLALTSISCSSQTIEVDPERLIDDKDMVYPDRDYFKGEGSAYKESTWAAENVNEINQQEKK